jgi:carbamoyl-phosphate synthase small subunit
LRARVRAAPLRPGRVSCVARAVRGHARPASSLPPAGEICFSTAMVGYPESLTDPSFAGQILCLSYVEIGNYGVPSTEAVDEFGLAKHFESARIQVAGLIVADYSPEHSHWNAAQSLGAWLRSQGVPALTGVDTRRIVKKIRDGGAQLAKIEFAGAPSIPFFNPNAVNLVDLVSTKAVRTFNAGRRPHVVAIDCGMKNNIVRCFVKEQRVQVGQGSHTICNSIALE